jgi:hypothetical protein
MRDLTDLGWILVALAVVAVFLVRDRIRWGRW